MLSLRGHGAVTPRSLRGHNTVTTRSLLSHCVTLRGHTHGLRSRYRLLRGKRASKRKVHARAHVPGFRSKDSDQGYRLVDAGNKTKVLKPTGIESLTMGSEK